MRQISYVKLFLNSYNKTNEIHRFLKFIFGIELYMFQTGFLSIFRSLVLFTQQQVCHTAFADRLLVGSAP